MSVQRLRHSCQTKLHEKSKALALIRDQIQHKWKCIDASFRTLEKSMLRLRKCSDTELEDAERHLEKQLERLTSVLEADPGQTPNTAATTTTSSNTTTSTTSTRPSNGVQELTSILQEVTRPLEVRAVPVLEHMLPELDLENIRVGTIQEVLLECFDTIHSIFNVDLSEIITAYCAQVSMKSEPKIIKIKKIERCNGVCAVDDMTFAVSVNEWGDDPHGTGVRIYDRKTAVLVREFKVPSAVMYGPIVALGDGRQLMMGAKRYDVTNHQLHVLDCKSGKCLKTIKHVTEGGGMNDFAVFPDARHVATIGSHTCQLAIWDIDAGKCIKTMQQCDRKEQANVYNHGHQCRSYCVLVLAGGRHLLSAGEDASIRLWDVESSTCVKEMKGHTDVITDLTLLNNEQYVVSVSRDDSMMMWDLSSGKCLMVMRDPNQLAYPFLSVTTLPDDIHIVSCSNNGVFSVWDTSTGQCIQTINSASVILEGGQLCVMPGGQVVSVGYKNGMCILEQYA